jgi:hypothetical protein
MEDSDFNGGLLKVALLSIDKMLSSVFPYLHYPKLI